MLAHSQCTYHNDSAWYSSKAQHSHHIALLAAPTVALVKEESGDPAEGVQAGHAVPTKVVGMVKVPMPLCPCPCLVLVLEDESK